MSAARSGASSAFSRSASQRLPRRSSTGRLQKRGAACARAAAGRIVLGDAKFQRAAVGREKAPQRPILPVDVPEQGACHSVPDQRLQKGRAVVGAFQRLSPDTRQVEDRRDAFGNVDP